MTRTLVIGSINMDIVNRVHDHPKPGETIHGLSLSYHPGGKGANQAVAAARSGAEVHMLGAVGNDEFSARLLEGLRADDIDSSMIKRVDEPTGMAFITLSDDGENTIIVAAGANEKLTSKDVDAAFGEGIAGELDTILLQNEIPIEATQHAMKIAKAHGLRVIFNPAPISGVPLEILANVDVVILNQTETEILTGVSLSFETEETILRDCSEAIRILLDAAAGAAVVTLGRLGAVYGTRSELDQADVVQPDGLYLIREKAFVVQPVDTTAAGDTFVGAFASMFTKPADAREALRFASAAAALAVTQEGAQPSVPKKKDVLTFMQKAKHRE